MVRDDFDETDALECTIVRRARGDASAAELLALLGDPEWSGDSEQQPPRRRAPAGAPTLDTHTTARVTVRDKRSSGATFEVQGASVELRHAGGTVRGTTNESGVFQTRLVPVGTHEVVVTAPKMGSVPREGRPVVVGPVTKRVTLVSNTALPAGQSSNEVTIDLARESPHIRVTVYELVNRKLHRLRGAKVEVIGVNQGTTKGRGFFKTRPIVPGKYNVHVQKSGYYSHTQSGDAFYRQVEITEGGIDFSTGSMDIRLKVILRRTPTNRIPPFVPNPIAIWASGTSSPHSVMPDPRQPSDTAKGQAGWDMGFQFSDFAELATKLHANRGSHLGGGPIRDHQVSRLAFVAHGAPGIVDVDQHESGVQGAPQPAESRSLTYARRKQYKAQIASIRRALRQDSVVYVAACQAGEGKSGEKLLRYLSLVWPTTYVVGLRSLGAVPVGNRDQASGLMHAGVRDTKYARGVPGVTGVREYEDPAIVRNLARLPWMSESSRHATVARDGNIIRRGEAPTG